MADDKARFDDFVEQLVKDPANPPQTFLLTAYLGRSSEDGHTRLYLAPDLSSYVDVPDDAILLTKPIDTPGAPAGGHHVWIDRGAQVLHGPVQEQRRRAGFFEGPITQQFLGAAHPAAGGAVQPEGERTSFLCTWWGCTHDWQCPGTEFPKCPPPISEHPRTCPSHVCHSNFCAPGGQAQAIAPQGEPTSFACPTWWWGCEPAPPGPRPTRTCPSVNVVACPPPQTAHPRCFVTQEMCPTRINCPSQGIHCPATRGGCFEAGAGGMQPEGQPTSFFCTWFGPCPTGQPPCPPQRTISDPQCIHPTPGCPPRPFEGHACPPFPLPTMTCPTIGQPGCPGVTS